MYFYQVKWHIFIPILFNRVMLFTISFNYVNLHGVKGKTSISVLINIGPGDIGSLKLVGGCGQ